MKEIYFDNAATTRVCPEAAQAAVNAMESVCYNPSSTHKAGREAGKLLISSREAVAAALGCKAGELYFTSCGTESDNWAVIRGAESMRRRGNHIITSTVEHDAVRRAADYLEGKGFTVTRLAPDATGAISVESVKSALREDTVLVSLMTVNNETGAVTDIAGVSRAIKSGGLPALLHTDAVQAFMKMPISPKKLGADLITISGHKIHAPKGVGALYIREGLRIAPYILGGSQEAGLRAGTENMPGIAAFAAACEISARDMDNHIGHMRSLRELAAAQLSREIPDCVFIGGGAAHILSVSLPGYRSEVLMNFLEARGIYVSKSSACKKGGRSHVLEAMELPAQVIDGALRISFSRCNTAEEVAELVAALKAAHDTLAHS